MFCLHTLPLARPAQAKIQMLTTRWRVIGSNLLFLIKLSRLYHLNIEDHSLPKNHSTFTYFLYTFRIIAYSFETIFQAVGRIDNGTASLGDDGSNIEIIEGPVLIPKVRSFIFFRRFLPYFSRSVSHFFANTFNFIFFRQNTGTGSQTNVEDFSMKTD